MHLHELSAIQLGRKLASREVGVVEACRAALDRIRSIDGRYQAFLTVDEHQVIEQAGQVQQRLDRGEKLPPLAGVPVAVKDNISTKGLRTTCASKMLQDYVPPYSATVIEKMQAAGLIVLGKANLDEYAMGSTTETSFFGPTRNPWDPQRVPGGSSGGPAAAVAAGETWLALGSDTGGSIRQPCSHCGLTGLKPTYGAVSRYGLIAYASSLDQIGPIGRDVEDCRSLYDLISGPDAKDSTSMTSSGDQSAANGQVHSAVRPDSKPGSRPLAGLRIGIPEAYLADGLQTEIRDALLAAADQLAALGAELEHFHLPLIEEAVPAYYLIATAEASSNLARYDGIQYGTRPDDTQVKDLFDFYCQARTGGFGREVRRRIVLGTFALSSGYYDAWYLKALKTRRLVRQSYQTALERYDMLLAPVSPTTAPRLGSTLADPLAMYLADIYTVSANLAGLPALSLPCGLDQAGLPIGMQLIGSAFSEANLLATGSIFQAHTDHHLLRPAAWAEC